MVDEVKQEGKSTKGLPKGCGIGCLSLVALFIILAVIGSFLPDEPSSTKSSVSAPRPASTIGIGVSRDAIISVLEEPELGFSFSRSRNLSSEEQEVYRAERGGNVIQLSGPADNLSEVFLGSFVEQNVVSLTRRLVFANVLDSNSTDWLNKQIEKASENPTKAYYNSKVFGQKLYRVSYIPAPVGKKHIGNIFALTISAR